MGVGDRRGKGREGVGGEEETGRGGGGYLEGRGGRRKTWVEKRNDRKDSKNTEYDCASSIVVMWPWANSGVDVNISTPASSNAQHEACYIIHIKQFHRVSRLQRQKPLRSVRV